MSTMPPLVRREAYCIVLCAALAGCEIGSSASSGTPTEDRLCDNGVRIDACAVDRDQYALGETVSGTLVLENATTKEVGADLDTVLKRDGKIVDEATGNYSVPPGTNNTYVWMGLGVDAAGHYTVSVSDEGCLCESSFEVH